LVAEPSGASALAALIHRDLPVEDKRVGVVISGGNISWPRFQELTAS
jgi:threonine dehydratase